MARYGKTMQRNWIGRSEGVEITFDVADTAEKVAVYTTRPDNTFYGVSYLGIAAAQPISRISGRKNPPIGWNSSVKRKCQSGRSRPCHYGEKRDGNWFIRDSSINQ